jgi:hypothetical protein
MLLVPYAILMYPFFITKTTCLAPDRAPRILDSAGLLSVIPADELHSVIDCSNALTDSLAKSVSSRQSTLLPREKSEVMTPESVIEKKHNVSSTNDRVIETGRSLAKKPNWNRYWSIALPNREITAVWERRSPSKYTVI